MAEKKITKSQRFEDIMHLLNGEDVQYGTTIEIAESVLTHEMELLAKKNSAERKPTAADKENEGYRELIVEYLSTQTEGKTCTEIGKGIPELSQYQNQKIAGLMRALVDSGKVTKATVKGKSLFSIA